MESGNWDAVHQAFAHSRDGIAALERLASIWISSMDLRPIDVFKGAAKLENWSPEQIDHLLITLSSVTHKGDLKNDMITTMPPFSHAGALVVVRTQGREFMVDGRRRANIWRSRPGRHPVLVIEAAPIVGEA